MDRPLPKHVGGLSVTTDVLKSQILGLGEIVEIPGDVLGVQLLVTCLAEMLTVIWISM